MNGDSVPYLVRAFLFSAILLHGFERLTVGVAILKKRTESANVDRWPYDLSQNGHKFLSDEGPGFMASSCYGCKRLELVTAEFLAFSLPNVM